MGAKPRLELTWIGKDLRPKLEPRVLLPDETKSYHASRRVSEGDAFDNRLIYGDNLLALKALEQEFAGKVKCVCIDPPYNTGAAFPHYDDGIEHSLWLSLMRDRLVLASTLTAKDGSIWIAIDDNEAAYLRVLCDELFGRASHVATIAWQSSDNSNNDAKTFSVDHNYILVISSTPGWQPKRTAGIEKRSHFKNPDNDPKGPWFDGNPLNSPHPRPNLMFHIESPSGYRIPPPANGWRWSPETVAEKIAAGEIRFTPNGRGIRRRTYLADMEGLPPSTLWADIEQTGHNRQAKYELKALFPGTASSELFATPKPERLIARIIELATNPGDLVLDSFAGSGTTGAVAHKMGRRWILIEQGEHCHTHIIPRLRKVIDGLDPGGVTEATGWKGGGGFRYSRVAPSLMEQDRFGNWVISGKFEPALLAEAVCKLEGFRYEPSDSIWWQHGRSTESDFLYVTRQTLAREDLQLLSDEVGPQRTLLVMCGAFRCRDLSAFPNLTVKKIPAAVLDRCEWGKDDYSLAVAALPPPGANAEAAAAVKPEKAGGKKGKDKGAGTGSLFTPKADA